MSSLIEQLQPRVRELVEAVVVQLPGVGDQPDLERVRRLPAALAAAPRSGDRERRYGPTASPAIHSRPVRITSCPSSNPILPLVFAYESETWRQDQLTRPRQASLAVGAPGDGVARRAALAAGAPAVRGALEPARWSPRPRPDARAVDPPTSRRQGRRARARPRRAALDLRRSRPHPGRAGDRHRLPSGSSRWGSTRTFRPSTVWHPVDELPLTAFDHGAIVLAGRERLRGKLVVLQTSASASARDNRSLRGAPAAGFR